MVGKVSYHINEAIRVPTVRVIDEDGKPVGILPTSEALEQARKRSLDLVEVAPGANPPVVRIMNLKRWLFEREKHANGKKEKRSELKELRIRPNIGENDLRMRSERAEEFLKDNNKVKLTVVFRGRELSHPELGVEKLKKMIELLREVGKPEKEPERWERGYEVTLTPRKNA